MTIDINRELYIADASCDFCSHSEEYQAEDFSECVDLMKEDGWRIALEDGEWTHKCVACIEKEREESRKIAAAINQRNKHKIKVKR